MNRVAVESKQFRLSTLFGVVTCIAVFLAATKWVLQADVLDESQFPVVFVPSITMMGVGILLVPLLCVGMSIASLVFVIRTHPRAITSLFFFSCVLLAAVASFDNFSHALRLLFVLSAGSVAFLAEALIRRLPRPQLIAALLSVGVTFGYYFFMLSALISASV